MHVEENVVYDFEHHLFCDVYRPPRSIAETPPPVVILVHGGAWMFGNKKRLVTIATSLCINNYVVCVVPEYNLSQLDHMVLQNILFFDWLLLIVLCIFARHKRSILFFILCISVLLSICVVICIMRQSETKQNAHPAHVKDIATCIQWVVQNANSPILHIDTNRLFLLGHSAGAHLCALATLNPRFLPLSTRACIRGVVCISGLYSFWQLQDSFTKFFINRGVFAEHAKDLTKRDFERLPYVKQCDCASCKSKAKRWEHVIDAWPMFHVASCNLEPKPRFLILTSDLDFSILNHAMEFTKELKQHQFYVQHLHFEGTNHFSIRKHWNTKHKHIATAVQDFLAFLS